MQFSYQELLNNLERSDFLENSHPWTHTPQEKYEIHSFRADFPFFKTYAWVLLDTNLKSIILTKSLPPIPQTNPLLKI